MADGLVGAPVPGVIRTVIRNGDGHRLRRVVAAGLGAVAMTFGPLAEGAHRDREPTPAGALPESLRREAQRADGEGHPDGGGQHAASKGHLPPSAHNVELVGRLTFADAGPGRVSDVSALGSYAYLGAFALPECRDGGVYVVDIRNPEVPVQAGFIPTAKNTYVGEGVQAVSLTTTAFRGDLLIHNNETCGPGGIGGATLVDVTDPRRPEKLRVGFGDFTDADGSTTELAHEVHSAFVWQAGERAFAVLTDDEEDRDVDIFEITDPRQPVLLVETGLPDWPEAQEPLARRDTTFFHDVQVRQRDGRFLMLLSYWDAGWVILDVTDPAKPAFVGDTDFSAPDPLTGFSPPEGNAHQAWFDRRGRYFLGTEEDFEPFRPSLALDSGPGAGGYLAGEPRFTAPIADLPDGTLNGRVIFGGYGCRIDRPAIPPASALGEPSSGSERILVLQRGPSGDPAAPGEACSIAEKFESAQLAGYEAAIVANHHPGSKGGGEPDAYACGGSDVDLGLRGLCTGHRFLHAAFGSVPAYDLPVVPAGQPGSTEVAVGTLGESITATSAFDGWGQVRLFDVASRRELDAYAIPEALDQGHARGFGALTVHEVETDDWEDLAYLAYYNGGFRVVRFGPSGIEEVGHYVAPGGNDFWGLDPHRDPRDGSPIVLLSDRDSGLWVLRYTGPRQRLVPPPTPGIPDLLSVPAGG